MSDPKNVLSSVAAFQYPILRRSLGQLTTSFGGFLATCAAMYLCLTTSLWMTLPLSVIAAGFLVRIFIIQHDCGHGVTAGQRYSRQPVQPDDSDAICVLAAAACTAPRFMEQSGPAGRERS